MEWLKANYPTILVIAVIVVLSGLIIVKLVRDHKAGRSSCGGCCGGCPASELCQMKKKQNGKGDGK